MGNWEKQQEAQKDSKERDKARREKLAGYFFDLSKLIFTALVLGGITPLFSKTAGGIGWFTIALGSFSTYIFAYLANRILK